MHNDLRYMHPDDNGQRVCMMALRQLSYRAIKVTDALRLCEDGDGSDGGSAKGTSESMCTICLERFDDEVQDIGRSSSGAHAAKSDNSSKDRYALPCGHVFHMACLDDLVSAGMSACPLCRDDVSGAGSVDAILEKVLTLVLLFPSIMCLLLVCCLIRFVVCACFRNCTQRTWEKVEALKQIVNTYTKVILSARTHTDTD